MAVPKPEGSPTPGPFNSPAHLSETPPPIIPLLPDLPFMSTHLVGCSFAEFLAKHRKNVTTLPAAHLTIIAARELALTPKRSKLRVIPAPYGATETCQD